MNVSRELPDHTTRRLGHVLTRAELMVLPGTYAFVEYPVASLPTQESVRALAFVRDDPVWSVLRPALDGAPEPLVVFSCHLRAYGMVGSRSTRLRGTPSTSRTPSWECVPIKLSRGTVGVSLLRRIERNEVHFRLISLWESAEAMQEYAGPDIERAQYFSYDLACLIEPEPNVALYEVLKRT